MSRTTEKIAHEARDLAGRTTAESGRVLADLANAVDQLQEVIAKHERTITRLEGDLHSLTLRVDGLAAKAFEMEKAP